MKTIEISTDVFALIWARRELGEECEDDILRKILSFPDTSAAKRAKLTGAASFGFTDSRYGVYFPEGFEVFRKYKGKDFRAVVSRGQWQITGMSETFSSLNGLSGAIGAGAENAWQSWFFLNQLGKPTRISELRDPSAISKKKRTPSEKLPIEPKNRHGATRWCDDVREALSDLGGEASLSEIYRKVIELRGQAGRSLPNSTEAVIRKELEVRSSDSEAYDVRRGEDWFELRSLKGEGVWGLRV